VIIRVRNCHSVQVSAHGWIVTVSVGLYRVGFWRRSRTDFDFALILVHVFAYRPGHV
jgi:hypothetical protein